MSHSVLGISIGFSAHTIWMGDAFLKIVANANLTSAGDRVFFSYLAVSGCNDIETAYSREFVSGEFCKESNFRLENERGLRESVSLEDHSPLTPRSR
ncbi:MAG: hypothetical protein ACI87E_003819 [Mariniblastus sp.]|jgi:hypothetical protein